ncbi:hypothetical protein ACTWJ8_39955 (plasmid) [Streptomyces sp. SDT5-1]
MLLYNIPALINEFDLREAGRGDVTGRLASLTGEELLLDCLIPALADAGPLELLPGRPRRDDAAFTAACERRPTFRDLDAWLALGDQRLVAVECKQLTAASFKGETVPEDADALADFARRQWRWLSDPGGWDKWDSYTKVALPLLPPAGRTPADVQQARRILAVWRPVSQDGISAFSTLNTTTLQDGRWVDVAVEVFSASLYLRGLLAAGVTTLAPSSPRSELLYESVLALFHHGPTPEI